MKYFIAHLLSGDAKVFHESVARELSFRFHTAPLYERLPPHITIKAPFETDEAGIAEVERILRALAHGERAAPITIRGFGRFGFRTVYLDVVKSPDAVAFVRNTLKILRENIPWLPTAPLEGNKLHASVARFLTRRQFRHIWRFLKTFHPEFHLSFDNIAILKKEGQTWTVHASIPLHLPAEAADFALPALHSDMMYSYEEQ